MSLDPGFPWRSVALLVGEDGTECISGLSAILVVIQLNWRKDDGSFEVLLSEVAAW